MFLLYIKAAKKQMYYLQSGAVQKEYVANKNRRTAYCPPVDLF